MILDLKHIASWRARHRGRGDMAYLLARIRRELEARWGDGDGDGSIAGDGDGDGDIDGVGDGESIDGDGDHNHRDASQTHPRDVLLLDFAGGDLCLGDGVDVSRICALESPAALQSQLDAAAKDKLDGVIICLQAAWLELPAWPAQILRALKPGGRLLFCTFGPDTVREVHNAWAAVDDAPHTHPFIDMHHIGDALLRCGFARPIVDADWVTVTYPDAATLHADLRAEGFANAACARRKTLTGRARFAAYQKALDDARAGDSIPVTFELIYGFATAPAPTSPSSPSPSPSQIRVAPPGP